MLSDPAQRALHHRGRKARHRPFVGWRNAAIMAGHWVLHGVGMFVVEERASGKFVGRVGPWFPPGWPGGFEVGWGIEANFAARAMPSKPRAPRSTGRSQPSSSTRSSTASTGKTPRRRRWRGGSAPKKGGEIDLFGHAADLWVTRRDTWTRASRERDAGAAIAGRAESRSRRGRIAPATGSRPRTDRRGFAAPGGPASRISAPSPAHPGTMTARLRDRRKAVHARRPRW